jgi:hypothetical protein
MSLGTTPADNAAMAAALPDELRRKGTMSKIKDSAACRPAERANLQGTMHHQGLLLDTLMGGVMQAQGWQHAHVTLLKVANATNDQMSTPNIHILKAAGANSRVAGNASPCLLLLLSASAAPDELSDAACGNILLFPCPDTHTFSHTLSHTQLDVPVALHNRHE